MNCIKWIPISKQDIKKQKPHDDYEMYSLKFLLWVEFPSQSYSQSMFGKWNFIDQKWVVDDLNKKSNIEITHYAEINEPLNY